MSNGTDLGPTGKQKNCTTWADYEEPGTETSKLCNGGVYEGKHWWPCSSRYDCKSATLQAQAAAQNVYQIRTPSNPQPSPTAITTRLPTANASPQGSPAAALAGRPPGYQVPAPQPVMPPPVPLHAAPMSPMPIVPPQAYPQAMQAPHVFHPQGHGMMGVTPTFLPGEGENVWGRLGKNIGQGMIGSFGYQIWSLASAVDFFGRR